MKVVFLDIDGVLNSARGEGPLEEEMEVEKLTLLSRLVLLSSSDGVVITSDRRLSKVDMGHKLPVFEKYGIKVLGMTRPPSEEDDYDNRGKQIKDYLTSTKEDIEAILILDDIDDGISPLFDEDFLLVNYLYGLNDDIFLKGLDILGH